MVTSSSRAGAVGFLFSAVLVVALLSPGIPAVEARPGGGAEARAYARSRYTLHISCFFLFPATTEAAS
jgi:hypothetical protein